MARSGGLLIQGFSGTKGNFEVVLPRVGGGFLHLWRNNDAAGFPWSGPDLAMGSEGDVTDVVLVADTLQPGELGVGPSRGQSLQVLCSRSCERAWCCAAAVGWFF